MGSSLDGLVQSAGFGKERRGKSNSCTNQEPGTDWMTMLCSWTPEASSFAFAPARRGSMILCGGRQFHALLVR